MVLPQAIVQPESRQLEYAIQLKRQEQAERQRLQQQDDYRKLELMSSIGPAALNKNFDKEVVNATIGNLMNNTKEYLRKNPYGSSLELQNFLNTQLSSVAQWSNKVQAIRDKVDEQFKGANAKYFDIPNWKSKTLSDALYIQNPDGSLKLRGLEELDTNEDYKTKAFTQTPEKFLIGGEVLPDWQKSLTSIPLNTDSFEKTVGTKSRRKTEKESYDYSPFLQYDKTDNSLKVPTYKDGPLKGLVTDEVYRAYVPEGSPIELYFKGEAKKLVKDPTDDAAIELVTRKLAGSELDRLGIRRKKDVQKDTVVNVGGSGSGSGEKKNQTTEYVSRVVDAINSNTDPQSLVDMLYEMKAGNGSKELSNVFLINNKLNFKYKEKGVNEDGEQVMTEKDITLDPNSKYFPTELGKLYQQFTGSQAILEKNLLGGKSGYKVSGSYQPKSNAAYIINGKTYTMADLTKLGYTQDDINSAIKAGTVKPK